MNVGELLRRLHANEGDDIAHQEMAAQLIERHRDVLARVNYAAGIHILGEQLVQDIAALLDLSAELPEPWEEPCT
jgi:hypothetical protein